VPVFGAVCDCPNDRQERHIADAESDTGRLALCGRGGVRNAIDGAWWPSTNDLTVVLPDLVAVFGSWIGPIRRVVYDPRSWRSAPSRIVRGQVAIAVDPYRLVAHDTIYLIGTHSRDAVLYVVPPGSSDEVADRVLRAVSDTSEPMSVISARRLVGASGRGEERPRITM
jgi:Family of unknown function (DUF5994)